MAALKKSEKISSSRFKNSLKRKNSGTAENKKSFTPLNSSRTHCLEIQRTIEECIPGWKKLRSGKKINTGIFKSTKSIKSIRKL